MHVTCMRDSATRSKVNVNVNLYGASSRAKKLTPNALSVSTVKTTRVSAAADRPARRSASAHAKYSVSHHMVIKPFLILGLAAEYRSRRSTVV